MNTYLIQKTHKDMFKQGEGLNLRRECWTVQASGKWDAMRELRDDPSNMGWMPNAIISQGPGHITVADGDYAYMAILSSLVGT